MKDTINAICHSHQWQLMDFDRVHGGDINQAFRIETNKGTFFIKLNEAGLYSGMLEAEAKGLLLLSKAQCFRVPRIIGTGRAGNSQYLLLEWIASGKTQPGFWENFGERLARLHTQTQEHFGLDFENYIGSLPQQNPREKSFALFYANHRLMPLVERLLAKGHINNHQFYRFKNFCSLLTDLMPEEPPALLHGDLWAGNYLVHENGEPVLIDPAPYYGHREMDLAMTRLFGGFDTAMYSAYQYHYPLEPGWKERIPVFQLYPLLVHAVLFGGGYINRCLELVSHFPGNPA